MSTSVRADGLSVAFGTKSGSVGVLDVGNHRNLTLLRSHTDKVTTSDSLSVLQVVLPSYFT